MKKLKLIALPTCLIALFMSSCVAISVFPDEDFVYQKEMEDKAAVGNNTAYTIFPIANCSILNLKDVAKCE